MVPDTPTSCCTIGTNPNLYYDRYTATEVRVSRIRRSACRSYVPRITVLLLCIGCTSLPREFAMEERAE